MGDRHDYVQAIYCPSYKISGVLRSYVTCDIAACFFWSMLFFMDVAMTPRLGGPSLDEDMRRKIVLFLSIGFPPSETARCVGCSLSMVKKVQGEDGFEELISSAQSSPVADRILIQEEVRLLTIQVIKLYRQILFSDPPPSPRDTMALGRELMDRCQSVGLERRRSEDRQDISVYGTQDLHRLKVVREELLGVGHESSQ